MNSLLTLATLLAATTALPVTDNAGTSAVKARTPLDIESLVLPCVMDPFLGCPAAAEQTTGDADDGTSTGVVLHNDDSADRTYFFYKNSCECVPYKYITIPSQGQAFVALEAGFQGRLMRGTEEANLDGASHILGTWVEFSWEQGTGVGWADVSLIKGCDGGATISALDGTGATTGFSTWVLDGAPEEAYKQKSVSGAKVIMETESLTDANQINTAARDYLAGVLGYDVAYIDDHSTNPVIRSGNGRFDIVVHQGLP